MYPRRPTDCKRTLIKTIALFAAMSVSACVGAPEGVLAPTDASAPGATRVSIMVATTRAPSDNPALLYTGERGDQVDFNELVVSIPPDSVRKIGEVQWPKKLPADPSREFATVLASKVETPEQVRAWYDRNKAPSGRLLLFVHGFNNRYERSGLPLCADRP
jgi:esterase/lipase superfamily enzyme